MSSILLGSFAVTDAGRDWSLLEPRKLERGNGYTTGGNLNPRRLEGDKTNIREQSRMFPYCSSGTPATDNCYKKCKKSQNCQAELVYYSPDQESIAKCRRATPGHIGKSDACVKIANNNALMNDKIIFNGELNNFHVHKTVEINAPSDMFIQLTVEDFNIGAKEMEGYNEKCGYGGIFIFSGHGDINQMVRITEFCGSMGAAVVDYENERYSGPKNFYDGVTSQIQSNRAIIAVMTNEHYNSTTIGSATATIKWDIVSPPESELIRGIDYLTDRIAEKWKEIGCNAASSLVEFVDGECIAKHNDDKTYKRRYRKFWRFYLKVLQVLDKTPKMSKLKCYANGIGPAVLLPVDSPIIADYYSLETVDDTLKLIKDLLAYLMYPCKLQTFWDARITQVEKIFAKLKEQTD